MSKLWLIPAIVALVVVGATAGDQMQCIKANNKGEIVLDREAKIGDATLPPGTYTLRSGLKDGKHHVYFVEEVKQFEVHPEAQELTFTTHAAEAPCTAESGTKATLTAVFYTEIPGGIRIKRAELKGEDHVHVF